MHLHIPTTPKPSAVYGQLWRFACERQRIYRARLAGQPAPWTAHPVLRRHRFTNAYRAADRVSQTLLREVIPGGPQTAEALFFRVLLFKLFNRESTWRLLQRRLGPLEPGALGAAAGVLDEAFARGERLYSAAYIMPAPRGPFAAARKHRAHLRLLAAMLRAELPARLADARSLAEVYEALLAWPSLGPFLAFQYSVDLNYSDLIDFSEDSFVAAGPGARDGLRKCFDDPGGLSEAGLIAWVTERQGLEFEARGLDFPDLWGRPLRRVDVQNLFCEVAKLARVTHPEARGTTGRTRIKQAFRPDPRPLPAPVFPASWGIQGAVDAWLSRPHAGA